MFVEVTLRTTSCWHSLATGSHHGPASPLQLCFESQTKRAGYLPHIRLRSALCNPNKTHFPQEPGGLEPQHLPRGDISTCSPPPSMGDALSWRYHHTAVPTPAPGSGTRKSICVPLTSLRAAMPVFSPPLGLCTLLLLRLPAASEENFCCR